MASTSNLFAALVGLTETPESTTDSTDEDGFIEIRRKHKGRTSQPAGRAPGNHGKQQGQQRRQQYQSQRQQQERTSTGRPAGTSAQNGGPAAKEAHEADLAESLDHATLREEPSAKSQRENGKSLSYAAVIADGSAPQQPAGEQATSAEPALSRPAEEGNASRSTRSTAAQPSVVAEGAAADAKGGNSRQSKSGLRQPLVWLDLEMTGLDLETDTIIEAACLVSDGSLDTVIEGPEVVIQQSEEVLESMNAWCIEHHGASGLTQRCRESTTSMQEAEEQLLAFVAEHTEPGEARLAGNSVHVDMQFLRRHMPRLFAHLHHRIVDVSTVAELCARWFPADYRNTPRKKAAHTALADVRDSLEELRFYKSAIFKEPFSQHRRRR